MHLLLALSLTLAAMPQASDLLARSIAYHDPQGAWVTRTIKISTEVRLSERLAAERGYASRRDRIVIDDGERIAVDEVLSVD